MAVQRQESKETKVKPSNAQGSMGDRWWLNSEKPCMGGDFDPLKSKPNWKLLKKNNYQLPDVKFCHVTLFSHLPLYFNCKFSDKETASSFAFSKFMLAIAVSWRISRMLSSTQTAGIRTYSSYFPVKMRAVSWTTPKTCLQTTFGTKPTS